MSPIRSISIAGAGNVAFHLGKALVAAGVTIDRVYNRTESKATQLADELNAIPVSTIKELKGSELIICCLSDDAVPVVLPELSHSAPVVSTAGTVDVLSLSHTQPVGVFYPLQSFAGKEPIPFDRIPIFVEASTPEFTAQLLAIGKLLSSTVNELSAAKRVELHLAAVFTNNFTNHLVDQAQQFLQEHELPFAWLQPLLDQTVARLHTQSAYESQTGPAKRHDEATLQKHLSMLTEEQAALYRQLSGSIQKRYPKP